MHLPDPEFTCYEPQPVVFYIGETKNIRKSLLARLHGDNPWITVWAPSRFSFELCPNGSKTELRNDLLARLQPVIRERNHTVESAHLGALTQQTPI